MYLTGAAAEAAACDATLTPVVTGQIDWTVLDQLTTLFLKAHGRRLNHGHGQDQDQDRAGGTARRAGMGGQNPPRFPPPCGPGCVTPCWR